VDPLSEVIALLDARSSLFSRFEGSNPWAIDFTGHGMVKFGVVLRGSCFIRTEGGERMWLAGRSSRPGAAATRSSSSASRDR
jgi:hypothetical protein